MRRARKPSGLLPIIIVRQIEKHKWTLRLPRIGEEADDQLEEGIDWIDSDLERARSIFSDLLKQYPEHIDAYHHLALCLEKMGRTEDSFEIRKGGVAMTLKFFPQHFSMERDRLEWGWMTNRPFLRLYHSYGLQLMSLGSNEDALEAFENILAMNPNDNQGVRALVVDCHFALNEPAGVVSVCRQFKRDALPELVYGRALALFQLGQVQRAVRALDVAFQIQPRVAAELLKTRHPKPKGTSDCQVCMGGPDEAWWYWRNQGKYWAQTPGAIALLRQQWPGKGRKNK